MNKSRSKRTHNANKEVRDLYDKTCEIAVNEVERLARKILKENPTFTEFTMAMGTWFFTHKDGRNYSASFGEVDRKCFKPLADFIEEWEDYLKITGHSMHFTATGPKITDW